MLWKRKYMKEMTRKGKFKMTKRESDGEHEYASR
jgi:hypothetical protein